MALSKAIALDACDAAKYLSLGRVRAALGEIEDAESLFQKALELIAKDSRMLTKVSIAFFKIQRFDRGAESALQAIRVDGADPEAWLWYANSVSKLGDRTRELGAREKVARLTGRSSDWARLSTSARRYGHIDLAVHAASNATRAEPGAACGWIALAKARIAQGACAEELREVSDEMVRLAKTAEDLCGAAEAFARMGEFHKAVELLEKSTRDEPAHGRAWELLAKVYLRIPGERQKAVLARRNWAERTKTVEAWIRHSQVCFRQGLYEEAVEAANNALGLDPNDVGARVLRARCLQQIPGRSKDAADAANRARRVARHPDHLAELSGYFNRSGLYDVAEELASAALALAPSHPVALRERESALRQKGVVERGGPLHESEIQALLNELRKERESADKWISTAKRLASANGADRMLAFVEEVVREDSHYSRGIDQALWEIVNIHPNGVVRLARRLTEIVPVPKVAAVWFLLGVAQRKCGDASGAVESIKEAVAINSDRAEFWYTLGKCNI
jgi:tetratricopeptide (TPR) repeat protein